MTAMYLPVSPILTPLFFTRGPIHVRSLGRPVQPAQHPALAQDSIPSSVKRIGGAVPQAAEGRPGVPGRRRRLARLHPLGAAGYQGRLQRGQQIFTGGGGVRLAADSAWTVHQHRQVAVAVLPQRSEDHDDRPPPRRHGTMQPQAHQHCLRSCCWPASSWSAGTVLSCRCHLSTTAPTECWSSQQTSSCSRWGIEPTKCPRSA
jgi:hypothetical protein